MIRKGKPMAVSGMGKGILWGAAVSGIVTIICAMILAAMLGKETISENAMGYGVMMVLILAAYSGGFTACKIAGRQRLTSSLLSGATYFGILLSVTALIFEAHYTGVGQTVLLILCGCVLAAMWTSRNKGHGKTKKLKI